MAKRSLAPVTRLSLAASRVRSQLLALAVGLSFAVSRIRTRLLVLAAGLSPAASRVRSRLLALTTSLSFAAPPLENRSLAIVTGLSLAVGLVFGAIAGALINRQSPTPANAAVLLYPPEQDDFIITAAEAYAEDHDLRLAQDRLARLHSQNLPARVERLATIYIPGRDVIALKLAGLALALGSNNSSLRTLNLFADSIGIQPGSARAELAADGNTTDAIARFSAARPHPSAAALPPAKSGAAALPLFPPANGGEITFDLPESRALRVMPPPTPTSTPAKMIRPKQPTPDPGRIVATVGITLPDYISVPAVSIPLQAVPSACTAPAQLPAVVDHTISLCANQEYPPIRVNGNNLTIYGDPAGTALIRAPGRTFGITVNGSNITIAGVHVDADVDPDDLNIWLCLYDNCTFKGIQRLGGRTYGGGILLDGTTNVSVISSTVSSGVIGVASVHGSNNKIVNNNLSNLNGWGAYLFYSDNSVVLGNALNDITRSCMGPDGASFTSGCESAGIAVIRSETNLFVNNHCERSSDCIYASGDGGYSSNDNKFLNNYCAASPHNCYEITFSTGNRFDYNVATSDPGTGAPCTYPFWISGSAVDLGPHNIWDCKLSAQQAFNDSQRATEITTAASGF